MRLESANIPMFEKMQVKLPPAPFLSHKPDFNLIKRAWQEFGSFKDILVIGHGGSITTFAGIHSALLADKNVQFLSTTDPERIAWLRKNLPKHQTLVIAISRSGSTVSQLEALMHFLDYTLVFITDEKSTLGQVAKKLGARIYPHPGISGRFSGLSEVSLIPAGICGLDVQQIYSGAEEVYAQYEQDNAAMQAAKILYALEQQGYVDVFMPVYSHALSGFNSLVAQLCHEGFAKDGQGQTYLICEGPESQHHANQRFLGGRKNIAGLLVHQESYAKDLTTMIPASLHSVGLRDGSLFGLNKVPLSFSMQAEYKGTWEAAKIKGVPVLTLSWPGSGLKEIGAYIAFWQMFAIYSAVLRGVNPFDQPEVESSKDISWSKRKMFGL